MERRKPTYLDYEDDRPRAAPAPVKKKPLRSPASSNSNKPPLRPSPRTIISSRTPAAAALPTTTTPTSKVIVANPATANLSPGGPSAGGGGGGLLLYIVLLAIPILLLAAWYYTVTVAQTRFPRLRNKRICLLIAHPDDEAMFFAPSVIALTERSLGNHVKILCLSTGDADGLGETRKKELVKSGLALGLREEDDVFVVDSPDFPDSMTTEWSPSKISSLLSDAFAPALQNPASPKNSSQPTATIDVLITFDGAGISSHPNHISLFKGARHFINSLIEARPGWDCPVGLYTLTTVGMARKYASFADVLVSSVTEMISKKETGNRPSPLLFISDWKNLRRAQRAMTDAHISQMRWFRWGWIGLSRYMVMNDLRLEKFSRKPVDDEDIIETKAKETAGE